MKFKNLSWSICTICVIFAPFLNTKVSVSEPGNNTQVNRDKFLGKNPSFAYAQDITHKLLGSRIITQFTPKNSQGQNIELNKLASSLGYDHFNWVNYVETDPYGITNKLGQQVHTPYNDPPKGGYHYDAADELPFYWDLVECDRCQPRHHFQNPSNLSQFELVFQDSPADYRLQPGEAIVFITNLVGVKQYDPSQQTAEWEILHTFRWKLTNPHPHFSQASLVDLEVNLSDLSPLLVSKMQQDGAVLRY